jgi:hypothetical protein
MLPQRAEQIQRAGIELIWLATDFFLTLAAKDTSLPLVVRFWDLTFLHGPAAMFSGLLALLDLCLPRMEEPICPEEMISMYRAECRALDPTVYATRVLVYMHSGGVTNELVEELRMVLSGTATDFDVSSSTNDDSSISTAATQKEKAVDLVDRNTWISQRLQQFSQHRSRSYMGDNPFDSIEDMPLCISESGETLGSCYKDSDPQLTEEHNDDSTEQPMKEQRSSSLDHMVSCLSGF